MPRPTAVLFTLLDPDEQRRSEVASILRPFVKHVEPHGQLDRLLSNWPLTGMVLVHDSGMLVAALQEAMRTRGTWRSHVVFSEAPSANAVVDAVVGGAIDYLDWPISENELLERMELWPSRSGPTGARQRRKIRARRRLASLTQRETEVLKLMMSGKTGHQVADVLQISARTAEIHRAHIKTKLGVGSNTLAVRLAIESELWLGVPMDGP